jgi:hypothetical protein
VRNSRASSAWIPPRSPGWWLRFRGGGWWSARTTLATAAAGRGTGESAAGWSITHVSVSGLFVGFCAWHIVLNRRPLLKYLRAAGGRGGALRRLPARETVAAAGIVGAVLALTVVHALVEG